MSEGIVTSEEMKMLRVSSLWFPLATVISMIVFVAWSSWTVSEERLKVNLKIDAVADNLKSLANTVEKLAIRVGTPDGDAMPRTQWVIDCLQMQILSQGVVVCPYSMGRVVAVRPTWGAKLESTRQ